MAIRGIGPKSAYKLIKKHGNIEGVLENINRDKFKIDENAFLYKQARELFRKPDVADTKNIKLTWAPPNEEGLVEFLCKEKGFEETRVRNAVKKLRKARTKGSQKRLESFFGPVTVTKRKKPPVKEKKKAGKKKARK
eukprot:CAMPEP_0167800014 /NCGR_PEP_ID=MMETSP0111_2-20121227/17453_1 /TAXON_ID=91324 /ORGANISM="Lotharella globosa, Strain CCCM811" /LENGTH=136 /DNA_ID=CAMNT_0007695141 /DNA_START=37 /DNA_END=447 /DNA_ORIENTATION=+